MKKITLRLISITLLLTALSGCVAEPYPYYGGSAPYYGTTYAPAYAYGEVQVNGYYPPHGYQHIYSNYNANYWHHQRTSPQVAHAAPGRSAPAPQRGGEAHAGGGQRP